MSTLLPMNNYSLVPFLFISITCQTYAQQQWTFLLSVTDGQSMITLTIGINPNGTDGFDVGLDAFAPPPPPSGSFDARLRVPSPPDDYITDIRSNSNGVKTWYMYYQAGTGYGPVVISWDSSALPSPMTITDNINGTFFSQDMSIASRVSSSNAFLGTSLRIVADITLSIKEQQKPMAFWLEQNYPNPFNPTTRIKYQIPNDNYVTLKVFDILGREVRTLVNETRIAGEHEVTFDVNGLARQTAGGLASGVYFYKLRSSSFVQTRKMFLQR
ncbi:MAG TPA: T9SS type A sorting domain-containing protein [Bacteroidota bacterium]